MTSNHQKHSKKADRVKLILEVRRAYRRFADLLQDYTSDSPPIGADFLKVTQRLSLMNRALALVALESASRGD